MAAIDFPASPTVGQIFTPANGVIYTWDGTVWLASGAALAGFRLLQRTVVSSAVASVDITNIASDINDLMFSTDSAVPVTNDAGLNLRFFDGAGAIDATANYYVQGVSANSTTSTGAAAAVTTANAGTGFLFNYNGAGNQVSNGALGGISVDGKVMGIRNTTSRRHMTFQSAYTNSANTAHFGISGGCSWANATGIVTGLRFMFGTGNIASGAFSVWGSP